MKIKIKENAYGELARLGLCGKWVEVDTRYLFNNQYNLKDYNLRVMDQDVSAVQDDERPGKVKCGYCGEMFDDREELETHYLQEEANAHNCETCHNYRKCIVDTIRTESEETDADGNTIETRVTKYIWGRKCSLNACNKFEHRNHKPATFTPENTYFLKYPSGYAAFFKTLSKAEQWKAMGFTWDETQRSATGDGFAGSYNIRIFYDESGNQNGATLYNKRREFSIERDDLARVFTSSYNIEYLLTWDEENRKRRENSPIDGFPKTAWSQVKQALDCLRDSARFDHKRILILGPAYKREEK